MNTLRQSTIAKIEDVLRGAGNPGHVPVLVQHDSWGRFVNYCEAIPEAQRVCDDTTGIPDDTPEDQKYAAVCKLAREGSPQMSNEARAMIDELDNEGLLATGPSVLGADVIGVAPIVPAYLLGHPESMLARVADSSARTPMRVYLGVGGGASITSQQLIKRGVAVTALVLAMSTFRAIELHGWTCTTPGGRHTAIHTWPMDTRPLDLTSIAHQIGSPTVHRVFAFSAAQHALNRVEGFPLPYDGNRDTIERVARLALECDDDDLVIPRATSAHGDPLIKNAKQWLQEVLASHIGGELRN